MADPSAQFTKCQKLYAAIDVQLQQLEETSFGAATETNDEARHALTENVNRLRAEVAALENVVARHYGVGIAATGEKAQMWRR
jgi:hypothetical protein